MAMTWSMAAPGNDSVYGEFGNDFVNGGDGDDLATGGPDNDTVRGGNGNDAVFGSLGHDTLDGGAGNDHYLQWGGDVISGNSAADAVITFTDGDASWTPNEIVDLDVGLPLAGFTHRQHQDAEAGQRQSDRDRARSRRRLRCPGRKLRRRADRHRRPGLHDTSIGGPDVVVVHEIAHNFDTEDENPGIRAFFDLTQWRTRITSGPISTATPSSPASTA